MLNSNQMVHNKFTGHTEEDFMKSYGMHYYHGTNTEFTEFDSTKFGTGNGSNKLGEGVYIGSLKKAQNYGNTIIEVYIHPQAQIIYYDDIKYEPRYDAFFDSVVKDYPTERDAIKEAFARKYFDGIKYTDDETIVFDTEFVKTKSQLIAMYHEMKQPLTDFSRNDETQDYTR